MSKTTILPEDMPPGAIDAILAKEQARVDALAQEIPPECLAKPPKKPVKETKKAAKDGKNAEELADVFRGRSFRSLVNVLEPLRITKIFNSRAHRDHTACNALGARAALFTEVGLDVVLSHMETNPEKFIADVIDEKDPIYSLLDDELKEPFSNANRKLLEDDFKAKMDATKRRLDHAIRSLKRKGVFSENEDDLYALADANDDAATTAFIEYIRMAIPFVPILSDGPDETAWRRAVELSVLLNDPSMLDDPSNLFGVFIDRHASEIRILALILSWLKLMSETAVKTIEWAADMDAACSATGGMEGLVQAMVAVAGYTKEGLQATQRRCDEKMENQRKTHEAREAALTEEIRKLKRENLPGASQRQRLENRITELEAALASRDREIEALMGSFWEEDEDHDVGTLPDLPETGVTFVGGHPNMVKHLRGSYPKWKFIEGGNVNFQTIGTPDYLCFWTSHLCHPAYHKAMSQKPEACRLVYCSSTNQEKLEEELRYKFYRKEPELP